MIEKILIKKFNFDTINTRYFYRSNINKGVFIIILDSK